MNIPANLSACVSASCHEADCGCPISRIKAEVNILNMNCAKAKVKKPGRICDCGILWKEQPKLAVVELKGGRSDQHLRKLVEQLQGGLDLLEQQLNGQVVADFFPILLYRGKRDPTPGLKNSPVRFRGVSRNIIARPCGTDLGRIVGTTGRVGRKRLSKRLGSRK